MELYVKSECGYQVYRVHFEVIEGGFDSFK